MNFKAVPIGKVSVGDEIRQKSDEELATFIENAVKPLASAMGI